MHASDVTKIKEIQAGIKGMLEERASLIDGTTGRSNGASATVISPSSYWSDFCAQFEYMLDLPAPHFAKLRNHTYHLTSDVYLTYYFGAPAVFRRASCYDAIVAGLPDRYVLSEPADGIGFDLNGKLVSWDIIRFQRAFSALYREGIFDQLARLPRRHILEIGGGYGGIAHQVGKTLERTTYIIVDLPETLVFAASYLSLQNPAKKIYLYDKDTFQSVVTGDLDSYDFILLPNYRLKDLSHIKFDLALNIASLQEMRRAQAEEYLDFIARSGAILYSDNQDHQPKNAELGTLYDLLTARFKLTEIPEETEGADQTPVKRLQRLATDAVKDVVRRVINRPQNQNLPTRRIICRPRG
jgi:hypothetical protein